MKFCISFLVIVFSIIDGIQNAPVIHPIHIHTIPLHPVTVRPTFTHVTTGKSVTTIHSSKFTSRFSSPTPPSTTDHHSSWWDNPHSTGQIILRICVNVILIAIVCKILENVCKSKKQQKPCKKESPAVLKNKMYISTIDGKREEPPPSYPEIHQV
jgi:hypothetical protein